LLVEIEKHPEAPIPAALRSNVMAFYQSGPNNYVSSKPKEWKRTEASLQAVKSAQEVELKISDESMKDQHAPAVVRSKN
jgi:hypothetical protein